MTWELPSSARMHWQTVQASCAIMSSSKVCTEHFHDLWVDARTASPSIPAPLGLLHASHMHAT